MTRILTSLLILATYLYAPAILLGWNGGHAGYVLVPLVLAILIALCVLGLTRRDAHARPRLWIPVLLLPATWVFIGIWGYALAVEPGSHLQRGNWVGDTPTVAAAFSLIVSVSFIIYQRGSRLFLTCYSIINLWITASVWLIAAMQVTGAWI